MPIGLTVEQRNAVHADGNSWVEACPGSGKTRVALAKILRESARLQKLDGSVLALSFSVNAKDELASRIAAHSSPSAEKDILVATIHGFCLSELVMPFAPYLRYGELQLALEGGIAYEGAIARTAARLDITEASIRDVLKFRRRAPDGSTFADSRQSTPQQHEIALTFWEFLLAEGYVDYPNALYIGLEMLRSRRWIREGLAARFPCVVVDEYQDCSDIQVALIGQLVEAGSSVFLVGDLFQCVFGFAGANTDALYDFADRIGAERRTLHGTHRCPQAVIDIAERVFTRNIVPVGEALARAGGVIFDHSNWPIPAIQRLVSLCDEHGIDRSDVAFVCTAKYRIKQIIDQLRRNAGINATFGKTYVEDDDWYGQMVEAYLLADRAKSERDLVVLGEAVYEMVSRFAVRRRLSHGMRSLVHEAVSETVLSSEPLPEDRLRAIAPLMNEGVAAALRRSGAVLREDVTEIERRLSERLREFSASGESYVTRQAAVDALRPEGKVRGYTYQGIKGLQFGGVAVVDIQVRLLPYHSSRDLWDDARKLYVGLTRSQGFLAVHAPNRPQFISSFYPLVMGRRSAEEVIGSPLPESLRLLDEQA